MPSGTGEPGDRGADQGGLHDVVAAAHSDRAVPLADLQRHAGDHHTLGAEALDVAFQLEPGVPPRLHDQFGPAGDLCVDRPPAGLADRGPVVVPGADRDAQREPRRDPARHDQLGEILPGQIRGERLAPPVRGTRRAYRGADGGEFQPAQRKRPPGQPHAHHPVPAELGTLGGHPVEGRVARLVHGLHQRAEGPAAARHAGGPGRVHGRAEHLADRFEAGAADGGELTSGQRGSPHAPSLGRSGIVMITRSDGVPRGRVGQGLSVAHGRSAVLCHPRTRGSPVPERPIIVFDVNETLLDLDTIQPVFDRIFGDPAAMRLWFADLIPYSETLTLAGVYVPFTDIGAAVLKMLAATRGLAISAADAAELTDRFATMPPHPEVPGALRRLREHGFRLFTLTDNTLAISGRQLEKAGIIDLFERRFSVDETVRRHKPAPEAYHSVATALDLDPAGICLIASHVWDTIGAGAAGWQTALILREGNAPLDVGPQPDYIGKDLDAVADQLIERYAAANAGQPGR